MDQPFGITNEVYIEENDKLINRLKEEIARLKKKNEILSDGLQRIDWICESCEEYELPDDLKLLKSSFNLLLNVIRKKVGETKDNVRKIDGS